MGWFARGLKQKIRPPHLPTTHLYLRHLRRLSHLCHLRGLRLTYLTIFRQRNLYYEFTFTCKIHIDTQHSHTSQCTTTTKNQNSIISLTLLICFLLIPFSFREFLTYRNHHKALCQIIPINSSLENTFLTKLPPNYKDS